MNAVRFCLAILAPIALSLACSTVHKVDYPQDGNPAHELSRMQLDLDKAAARQYALIAPTEMERAQSYQQSASRERNRSLSKTWDDLGYARAYLNRAEQIYRERFPAVKEPLQAREAAIGAGARRIDATSSSLDSVDRQFAAAAPKFYRDSRLADVFSRRYRDLEIRAVQESRLGGARRLIKEAVTNGARDYAPQTLREARRTLSQAESSIAEHPREKQAYADDVARARRAARWLTAVNATARSTAQRTDEQVAQELLNQNRNLADLRTQLRGSELESEMKGRALAAKAVELRETVQNLNNEREIERTLADVRHKFAGDEANVYRDGDKLLIQLKKMDFKTGSAVLPDRSRSLLSKVKSVIRDVHAKDVTVQGHADGTGSLRANQNVSEARAEAVADYIEDETGVKDVNVVGLGENRPLRSNKTASGRAMNRRVDVVITPALNE